jgi:hypothetical protein
VVERDPLALITDIRRRSPERIVPVLRSRRRRPLLGADGRLFLVAADHPARGVLGVGAHPLAMADRGDLLRRLVLALGRPGVDGVMATPDVVEDLALLGALDDRVVFGSMNRGGLAGSAFELDDRFTAYTATAIAAVGLDGGKMMVRISDGDAASLSTLTACAGAISELAALGLPALVEVFGADDSPEALMRAVAIASGLGETSARTWLKLPVLRDMPRVLRATSLPVLLLGGDPGADAPATYRRWAAAMALPQVFGLVAGRTVLYPEHGDVARAVDEAAEIAHRPPPEGGDGEP